MDTALVTGADSGIGLQIARQLVELGYRVYGLAADFSACNWQHHDFMQVVCDLSRTDHLQQAWEHIAAHNPQVGVVVFAQVSPELPNGFEATAAEDIAHCVQGGLLAPLLLTRWALPSLVRFRGHVINVGWNGQGVCRSGAAAAAIEGGLYHWTQGLFDELRDTGVKVCTVYPWRNPGAADAKARLKLEPQSEVDAKFVARAVAQLLQSKENNLVAQIVVRPQGTREEPRIAPSVEPLLAGPKDIVLPDPDKRPPPPAPIPTPEPHRPDDAWEFDDEDEEDEWEEDDELDALLESSRRILREQNETARRQLQHTREKGARGNGGRGRDSRQGRGDNRSSKDAERSANRSNDAHDVRKGQPRGESENRPSRSPEASAERRDDRKRAEGSQRGERDQRTERAGYEQHEGRAERSERSERAEHPNREERTGRRDRSVDANRSERPDHVVRSDRLERSESAERLRKFADAESGDAVDSHGAAAEAQRDADESGEGKRRRRRRRGGRGRNRRQEGDFTGENGASANVGSAQWGGNDRGHEARADGNPSAVGQSSTRERSDQRGDRMGRIDSASARGSRPQERPAPRAESAPLSGAGSSAAASSEKPLSAESGANRVVASGRAAATADTAKAPVEKAAPPAAKKTATRKSAGKTVTDKVAKSTAASAPTDKPVAASSAARPSAAKAVDSAKTTPAKGQAAAANKAVVQKGTAAKKVVEGAQAKKAAVKKTATKKAATKKAAAKKTARKAASSDSV